MPRLIRIPVKVRDGTVICGRVGGNVRLDPGDKISWTIAGNRKIRLEFFLLRREGGPRRNGTLRRSPFKGGKPAVGPVRKFVGTIAPGPDKLEFKYYVTVLPDQLRLDPIIIVH
jgi:hypothetical protein